MPKPIKIVLAVLIGFVVWFVVATVANLLIRASLSDYAAAELATRFTVPMLFARLVVGAVSSVAAGLACALSIRTIPAAVKVFAVALVLFFLPCTIRCGHSFRFGTTRSSWFRSLPLCWLAPGLRGFLLGEFAVRPNPAFNRTVDRRRFAPGRVSRLTSFVRPFHALRPKALGVRFRRTRARLRSAARASRNCIRSAHSGADLHRSTVHRFDELHSVSGLRRCRLCRGARCWSWRAVAWCGHRGARLRCVLLASTCAPVVSWLQRANSSSSHVSCRRHTRWLRWRVVCPSQRPNQAFNMDPNRRAFGRVNWSR